MQCAYAAHGPGFEYDVGGLGGGAYHDGKMHKVPVVRLFIGIAKIQTSLVAGILVLRKII